MFCLSAYTTTGFWDWKHTFLKIMVQLSCLCKHPKIRVFKKLWHHKRAWCVLREVWKARTTHSTHKKYAVISKKCSNLCEFNSLYDQQRRLILLTWKIKHQCLVSITSLQTLFTNKATVPNTGLAYVIQRVNVLPF